MDKEGVEITFNWIFVLIGGVILLLFLIYFASQQIGLFNKLGINEVVESINRQIDSFSIGDSSSKVIKLLNGISINFECGDVIYKNKKKDTFNLIYGEGTFKDSFNLWTRAWVFPFKLDNLYYIGEPKVKYFIIGDDNFLFNIPDRFKKFSNFKENVNKNDVIIDFSKSNLHLNYKNNKVLVVDKEKGSVTFYPEKQKEEFFGESMLIGALFTNIKDYKCLKKKSLDRLELVADLYKKKAGLLKLNSKCSFNYAQMETTLDLFKKQPLKYNKVLIEQNDNLKREGCANVF